MNKHTERLELIDINKLIPYTNNARTHSDEQIKKIQSSLREFGFVNPVLIDKDCGIIAGHGRVEAAKREGMTEVPCVWVEHLTEAQKKAYILADNRLALDAGWDMEVLKVELAGLQDIDFNIDLTGFNSEELSDIFGEEEPEIAEDDYEVDLPEEPKAKLGDIYQLGRHRLMCGDSTMIVDVEKLMNGKKARMLFTSPPYSDMREYEGGKDLGISNIATFIAAYRDFTDYQCVNLGIQRKDHAIFPYWDEYIDIANNSGYKLMAWNIWDKTKCGSIGNQSAFFPIRHEWIFVFGTEFYEINHTWKKADESIKQDSKERRVRQADGSMSVSTTGDLSNPYKQMESVLRLLPEQGEIIKRHPATFPVQLPSEYIQAMTDKDDIVIEPFCGSGTTLIACEQTGRICCGMELEPKYVDVIIDRWEQFTGQKAVKL